jgi:hypothetical protein
MKRPGSNSAVAICICALAILVVPSILSGEILYLKDGSEIRGKTVSLKGDTLTFAPDFGGRIKVHRQDILRLVFEESESGVTTRKEVTQPAAGQGVMMIVFEDNKLTSKIKITNKTKKIENDLIKANWIEQLLIVDADTLYARVDSTMDKTIYDGHEKLYKNTIHLEDMSARVDPGVHRCLVVVRNVGADTYKDEFAEGPIALSAEFEMANVHANEQTELRVAIKKGFLRLGQPKLQPLK